MGLYIRLSPRSLDDRIDATYYRPEYVANAQRLESSNVRRCELSSLVSDARRTLYFGTTTLESDEAPPDWVPFLTSDDLGDGGFFVETRARRRVAPSFLEDYPAGRLRSGELLVKVKGPNQTTAYINTAPEYPVLVSGTIWGGLVRKDVVDPNYLVAALSCPYAATARTRLRTNLNVEFLSAEDLLSLSLPTPSELAQRYIGDKVRQAERLRARARRLEQESAAFFQLPEWTHSRAGERRSYTAGRSAMRAERLDAPFYDPAHEALEVVLKARQAKRISDFASMLADRWDRESEEVAYFEIGELDIASGMLSPTRLATEAAPSRAQLRVEPWDVLVSTVRPARKNIGLVSALDDSIPLVASTGFAPLRFGSPEQAAFFHAFLRSDVATQQLIRWNSGATFPAIESDVPLAVLVPPFADELIHSRGARWLTKFRALEFSTQLTQAATTLVEQLIDARLTEADLIAAQKALDDGDRTADRAILSSLRARAGADAKPLIPDVDALYALLDDKPEGQEP